MSRKGENIYKRKDGRWEGRYIKGYEQNQAKYGYVYSKSYKELKIKLQFAKNGVEHTSKMQLKTNGSYFSFWLDSWLSISKIRVKESTYIKYRNTIQNHIKPELGSLSTNEISTFVVEKFIVRKLETLSSKSVSDLLIIIKDVIRYARSEGVVVNCQLDRIVIKKYTAEIRILDINEEKRLIKTLTNDINRCKLGVLICLFTGIRIGELCALKGENISIEGKYIKIDKTMQRLQYAVPNKQNKTHIVISEPKSEKGKRIIPLQDNLIVLMNDFMVQPDCYFLTASNEKIIEPRVLQNKFKNYLNESNIVDVNFHCLRHTFATRCIELGFDIKTLSEILGHASVKTTLDKYVHSSEYKKRENMNKLNILCS